MRPTTTRRFYRRRSSAASESKFFKKDNQQEQGFFSEPSRSSAFFQPNAAIQRKCESCEKEEKGVQRAPEKKEEDKKLQRVPEKKEDEKKLQRMTDKKEEEKKIQPMTDKKEEEKKPARKEDKKEEDKKLRKKEAGPAASNTATTASYIGSLNGKGTAMPATAKQFFSSKMGYDFNAVKIHTGTEAEQSAKSINAKAYTIGNDIVFNEGQYDTSSSEGKKLLAHELTHVMQQNGQQQQIDRAISYGTPTIHRKDPIPMVLSTTSSTLGKTYMKVNGVIVADYQTARKALWEAINNNLTLSYDGKACKVNVTNINVEIAADEQVLTMPTGTKWSGTYAGTLVPGCDKSPAVPIEMTADMGAAAFEQRIADDEKEHADDLIRIAKKHLDAFYSYLSGISLASDSADSCADKFKAEIGAKDLEMIDKFLTEWLAAVDVHDKSTGNHHHNTVTDNRDCNLVKINATS